MPQDAEVALPTRRALPAEALASLAELFDGEVTDRLPRLQAAACAPELLDERAARADVQRDAHALGSSAAVVGRPAASRCARAVEALLEGWPSRPDRVELARLVHCLTDELA